MLVSDADLADLEVLLKAASCDEVVLETRKQRILLRRVGAEEWVQEVTTIATPVLLSSTASPVTVGKTAAGKAGREGDGDGAIRAPLPGIFYRAPKPGAPPFVELGAKVTTDTVVGIVETMKLMNSVHAGVEGEIAEICIANGEQVEAQDLIMRVESRP